MTTYNKTSEQVKLSNGKVRTVYSKMTKKGNRFFTYSLGRWFPISKQNINESILLSVV